MQNKNENIISKSSRYGSGGCLFFECNCTVINILKSNEMQKFKKYLIEKMNSANGEGSSVWATNKDFQNGNSVVLLNVGKSHVATVVWSNEQVKVQVPELGFEESGMLNDLSRDAMRIISEVKSYLN